MKWMVKRKRRCVKSMIGGVVVEGSMEQRGVRWEEKWHQEVLMMQGCSSMCGRAGQADHSERKNATLKNKCKGK